MNMDWQLPSLWPSTWFQCCTQDSSDSSRVAPARLGLPFGKCRGLDEEDEFFDCAETDADLCRLRSDISIASTPSTRIPESYGGISFNSGWHQTSSPCLEEVGDPTEIANAMALLGRTRRSFSERNPQASPEGPEMDWANMATARRLWRACEGNERRADKAFLQAMEIRLRDRALYTTLRFQKCCDMRIIGYDQEKRPVVYFCAASQTEGLGSMKDQFIASLEAASRMSSNCADGQLVLIVDMHGLQTRLNADFSAINDLAETLGCVFAERMRRIIIVDFSSAAQTLWWIIKPFLSHVTQRKFSFVCAKKAKELCRDELDQGTAKAAIESFEVNREDVAEQTREMHNERTTVPFWSPGPE